MFAASLVANIHPSKSVIKPDGSVKTETHSPQHVPFVGKILFVFLNAEWSISTDGITMGNFWKAPTVSSFADDLS